MKVKHLIYSAVALMGMTSLGACQNHFDEPEIVAPVATWEANTTIADLKARFMGDMAIECPVKDEATGEHYIVKGRVISSDATGNIYQTLVIQDETGALPFTIRRASLYDEYHLGQEVLVDLTGLWLGRYNSLFQCGWLGEPYQGSPQLTFMDYEIFAHHTQLNGFPNTEVKYVTMNGARPADSMYCIVMSPDQLSDVTALSPECVNLQSQLVQFRNVQFVNAGVDTYATYQETVNRYIYGSASKWQVVVRNSGYATFYNDLLPVGSGRVTGILSWYGSGSADSRTPDVIPGWQLLLRGLYDVVFDNQGTREAPYTVDDVISFDNNGLEGWMEGYIVGSVKSGVSEVTSADQCIFGTDAELDNNILVAAEAGCTDPAKCVVISLPQNSLMRQYVNLADNAGVYKKKMKVYGTFDSFLGMNGLVPPTGGAGDFDVDGLVIPGVTGMGSGTESDPYMVGYVLNHSGEGQDGVWVSGYIVGFVEGTDATTGARFTNEVPSGANYNNGNLLIAATPDVTDINECAVVRLTVDARKTLGMGNAPGNYKKQLLIKGSLEDYLGRPGVRMSEAKVK